MSGSFSFTIIGIMIHNEPVAPINTHVVVNCLEVLYTTCTFSSELLCVLITKSLISSHYSSFHTCILPAFLFFLSLSLSQFFIIIICYCLNSMVCGSIWRLWELEAAGVLSVLTVSFSIS